MRVTVPAAAPAPGAGRPLPERRENVGARRRAIRLSLLYGIGLAAVYAALVASAQTAPSGGSAGSSEDLLLAGLLAAALAAAGALVALGAAPRAVVVGEDVTVVIGRFGHRYRYPGRARLRTTVLQRVPAGLLSPVPLESVELAGGSSRRAFLIEEGLLEPGPEPSDRAV